jgi:hypothetical protein
LNRLKIEGGRQRGIEEIGEYPGEWPVDCALGRGADEMGFYVIEGRGAERLICNSASPQATCFNQYNQKFND